MNCQENSIRADLNSIHEYDVNIRTREIFLHGYYTMGGVEDDEPGVDYRMASLFCKNLSFLNNLNDQPILIHQHTVGGNWNDGIAIYDSISTSIAETILICYAQASSMSSITIQASTTRVLMPNTEVMIHYGFYGVGGIPSQVESGIKRFKKIDEIMLQIYAKRCIDGEFFSKKKMTEKDIMSFIDKKIRQETDWFLDAEEAIYYGFADIIMVPDGMKAVNKVRKMKINEKAKRR